MNETQAAKLGRLLAQARRNKGLSIRGAAHQANVDFAWLGRLEQGRYQQPAPERIARLVEVLGVDPERVDRLTKGHLSNSLPSVRTYFRSKYDLTAEEIDRIEQVVQDIQHNHERGNDDTNRNENKSD